MAERIKCLLYRCVDQSSELSTHVKSRQTRWRICNPRAAWEASTAPGSIKGSKTEQDPQSQSLASTCDHECTHMCTHIHTYLHLYMWEYMSIHTSLTNAMHFFLKFELQKSPPGK